MNNWSGQQTSNYHRGNADVLLIVLDWNSWVIPYEIRFLIGVPFV